MHYSNRLVTLKISYHAVLQNPQNFTF